MVKILAYIQDFDLLSALMKYLHENPHVKLLALSSLPQDPSIAELLNIDVCLLDCTANAMASLRFASALNVGEARRVKMVYMFQNVDHQVMDHIALTHPEASFLYAPFTVFKMMNELLKKDELSTPKNKMRIDYETMASKEILGMGIPAHLNGFHYIRTAAILLMRYEKAIVSMKQLYKETARIHTTTATRVEKAIRDAIDYAYRMKTDAILLHGRKPTNSQLIHLISERMLAYLKNDEREIAI